MRRLPRSQSSFLTRLREFLFGARTLRWNPASALALAAVVIVAGVAVSRLLTEPAQIAAPGPGETATVRLTFYSPQAQRVAVAGNFNKWSIDADQMRAIDGMWSIELKLTPGVYAYSFIVDGSDWVLDPGAESYRDDGFGSRTSVLRVDL